MKNDSFFSKLRSLLGRDTSRKSNKNEDAASDKAAPQDLETVSQGGSSQSPTPSSRLTQYSRPVYEYVVDKDIYAAREFFVTNRAKVRRSLSLEQSKVQIDQFIKLLRIPVADLVGESSESDSVNSGPLLSVGNELFPDLTIVGLGDKWFEAKGTIHDRGPFDHFVAGIEFLSELMESQQPSKVEITDFSLTSLAAIHVARKLGIPIQFASEIRPTSERDYWSVLERKIARIALIYSESFDRDTDASAVVDDDAIIDREKARIIGIGKVFRPSKTDAERLEDYLANGVIKLPPHKPAYIGHSPTFVEDPFNDNNWRFSYHKFTWADVLRKAYSDSKDESLKQLHLNLIRSWILMWGDPYNLEAPSQVWSDMGAAIRARCFALAIYSYGNDIQVIESLRVHLEWLKDPANWPKRGNHLLHVLRATYEVATVLRDRETENFAVDKLFEYFRASFTMEGEDIEG